MYIIGKVKILGLFEDRRADCHHWKLILGRGNGEGEPVEVSKYNLKC